MESAELGELFRCFHDDQARAIMKFVDARITEREKTTTIETNGIFDNPRLNKLIKDALSMGYTHAELSQFFESSLKREMNFKYKQFNYAAVGRKEKE